MTSRVGSAHIELNGLPELEALFRRVAEHLGEQNTLRMILEEAKPIGRAMAAAAPKRSGRLAAATKAWISKREGAVRIGTKYGGKRGAPHAHFVEYGTAVHAVSTQEAGVLSADGKTYGTYTSPTISTAAQPYVRPTWDSHQAGLLAGLTARFQKVLDNIAAGSPPPPLPEFEDEGE